MKSFAVTAWILVLLMGGCSTDRPDPEAEANANRQARPVAGPSSPEQREVAFTFDDLPASRDGTYGLHRMQQVTTMLLGQLEQAGIPAVGFVNEGKLGSGDGRAARIALLRQWLDAGIELGNHTYRHRKFWDTPLEAYEQDVLHGERVIRPMLAESGKRPRYFRHPYLNTGRTAADKAAFERFLSEHGYTIAPVTIDNLDVLYALAYDNAHEAGNDSLKQRIATAYIDHMRESFEYFEQLSRSLLRREPAQVLMLHANALNADHLHELIAMLQQRGYVFIPLERALEDSAYTSSDTYIGSDGPSWLRRWAVTRGSDPGKEPRAPQWIERVAYPQ